MRNGAIFAGKEQLFYRYNYIRPPGVPGIKPAVRRKKTGTPGRRPPISTYSKPRGIILIDSFSRSEQPPGRSIVIVGIFDTCPNLKFKPIRCHNDDARNGIYFPILQSDSRLFWDYDGHCRCISRPYCTIHSGLGRKSDTSYCRNA